jgi:sigma-E factor negative regulatory protein RseA
VLRSDDLATPPARDAAFLCALRPRLAAEPVVLAPEPPRRARSGRWTWMAPPTVAAGFVLVTGALLAHDRR